MTETGARHPTISFVLVAKGLGELPRSLRGAFIHPWVASYQIGFGPPLFKATPRLAERLKTSGSVLEKLDLYLEHCMLDPEERVRLAGLQRRLAIRRFGPLEAETLDRMDAEALDLELRLHVPARAPEAVQEDMKAQGMAMDKVPEDGPPEPLSGRFVVHLADPANQRLLHVQAVEDLGGGDGALALELRVPGVYFKYWKKFVGALAEKLSIRWVMLADPVPHARMLRNGQRN
jgi:hypothetical protein